MEKRLPSIASEFDCGICVMADGSTPAPKELFVTAMQMAMTEFERNIGLFLLEGVHLGADISNKVIRIRLSFEDEPTRHPSEDIAA